MRKRNPDIYIEVGELGSLFAGNISNWENSFGGLTDFNDDEAIEYIKDWAINKYQEEFVVFKTFDESFWTNTLSKLPSQILENMKIGWNRGDYTKCSYQPQVLEAIETEINNRRN